MFNFKFFRYALRINHLKSFLSLALILNMPIILSDLSKEIDSLSILSSNLELLDYKNQQLRSQKGKSLQEQILAKAGQLKPVTEEAKLENETKLINFAIGQVKGKFENDSNFPFLKKVSDLQKRKINDQVNEARLLLDKKVFINSEIEKFDEIQKVIKDKFEIIKDKISDVKDSLKKIEDKFGSLDKVSKEKFISNVDNILENGLDLTKEDDVVQKLGNLDKDFQNKLIDILSKLNKIDTNLNNVNLVDIVDKIQNQLKFLIEIEDDLIKLFDQLKEYINSSTNNIKNILSKDLDLLVKKSVPYQSIVFIRPIEKLINELYDDYEFLAKKYYNIKNDKNTLQEIKNNLIDKEVIEQIKSYINSDYNLENELLYNLKVQNFIQELGKSKSVGYLKLQMHDIKNIRDREIKEFYKLAYLYINNEYIKKTDQEIIEYKNLISEAKKDEPEKNEITICKSISTAKNFFEQEKASQKFLLDAIKDIHLRVKIAINASNLENDLKTIWINKIDKDFSQIIDKYNLSEREQYFMKNITTNKEVNICKTIQSTFAKFQAAQNKEEAEENESEWED